MKTIDEYDVLDGMKLCQASPDLLQALMEVVEYFHEWQYVMNDEFRAMLDRCETAINKAI